MVVATKSETGNGWCTPKHLADLLGRFGTDPCSNERSHIQADTKYSLERKQDGLTAHWYGSTFINWPFDKPQPWADRVVAHHEAWVVLCKLDPSTRWWSTLMSANPTVAPFRKRIKFEGDRAMTANFPCALVYKRWAPSDELAQHLWLQRWG